MAQYRVHSEKTLEWLQHYLKSFHDMKSVFLEYRLGKKGKKKIKSALVDARAKANGDTDADADADEDVDVDSLQRIEDAERQMLLEKQAHFNFPKMHLLLHYCDQIREFGELVQYSTEVSESMHGTFEDAYRRSNRNDAVTQILDIYIWQYIFDMHQKNLKE